MVRVHIKAMGPVRGRSKANTCVSQGLARVPRLRKEEIKAIHDRTKAESKRSEEERLTNPPTEDHGRQKHLGSPISNSLHQKESSKGDNKVV